MTWHNRNIIFFVKPHEKNTYTSLKFFLQKSLHSNNKNVADGTDKLLDPKRIIQKKSQTSITVFYLSQKQ